MKHIKEFQKTVETLFPIDIREVVKKFGDLDESDSPANKLQISVLEGEFYPCNNEVTGEYYNEIFTTIGSIKKILGDNSSRLQGFKGRADTSALTSEKGYGRALEFIKYSKRAISSYENFIKIISENLKEHESGNLKTISSKMLFFDVDLIFKLSNTLEEDTTGGEPMLNYILFCVNLSLAEIDENLDCSENVIYRISQLKTFLDENYNQNKNTDFFVDILREKCSFLNFKIHLRKKRCLNRDNQEFLGLKQTLQLADDENKYKYFQAKYDKSLKHYTDNNLEIKKRAKLLEKDLVKDLEQNQYRLEAFHAQNKYLKITSEITDVEKNSRLLSHLETLSNIKDSIHLENIFDQIAVNSTINLLQNTQVLVQMKIEEKNNFQQIIENLKSSNESVFLKNLFNKLHDKSRPESFIDYHGLQKYLEFLDKLISYLRDEPLALIEKDTLDRSTEVNKINEIKTKIDIIKTLYIEAFRLFKDNLNIYKYRKYKPVYLTRSECHWIVKDEPSGKEINLFLDSSYVLPDDYDRILEKWFGRENYLKGEIRSLKNRIENEFHRIVTEKEVTRQTEDFTLTAAKTTKEFGEKTESFEKRVKDNEFKMVQIVAMFVTIATFVLINVKLFDNKSLIAGFSIMFGLASCLLLFNAFFNWLIIQRNEAEMNISWSTLWRNGLFRLVIIFFVTSILLGISDQLFITKSIVKTEQKIKSDSTFVRSKIQSDSLHIQKRMEANQKDIQKNEDFIKQRIESLEKKVFK